MEAQRLTVLLADDDEELRHAVASWLEADGYDVIEVGDGATALELLAAAADGQRPLPDVLVLDFCMPELSGIGILRVLRKFGQIPPTILITAFPDPSVATFARSAGAAQVIRKPIDGEQLRAAMQKALRRRTPAAVSKGV